LKRAPGYASIRASLVIKLPVIELVIIPNDMDMIVRIDGNGWIAGNA
jgi:hypothetical protein